ncbi:hypothetical protein A3Q56_07072 [Intoshia linei]|uniref:Farnesyl pyrophosphate synthase n=1 Tax=Intoshia linei TaxID=1819745 RepID=A0A177AUC9_9BILA|nr:hypothetical protein A3Q56_07072 [Intoshia linei]
MDALENFDVKDLLKSFIERIFENDSIDAYFPKNVTDQARKHFIKVLKYNLLGGKMHRGCSIISGHKILCNWFDEPATQVDIQRCCAIGACIEILQYGFLMADDIMDNSTMRRGKACWHCLPEIEKTAINDSMFLSHYIYFILRKFLVDAEYYLHIVHLFQDYVAFNELFYKCEKYLFVVCNKFGSSPHFLYKITQLEQLVATVRRTHTIINTISGQCMDMLTSRPNESCNLSKFTMEQYLLIITEKTGYYSFNLPVIACLLMQKIYDKKVHEKATKVLLKMGRYFQIQMIRVNRGMICEYSE